MSEPTDTPVVRTGVIAIKARPEPGEGRWAPGIMPALAERPTTIVEMPRVSALGHDAIRAGLVAALAQADIGDAIGAALGFLLHCVDQHPHVLRTTLSAEVSRGAVSCRIIDVLNKGVR